MSTVPIETLRVDDSQVLHREILAGVFVTLTGPALLEIGQREDHLILRLVEGTLVGSRAEGAAEFTLEAGDTVTKVRQPVFAISLERGTMIASYRDDTKQLGPLAKPISEHWQWRTRGEPAPQKKPMPTQSEGRGVSDELAFESIEILAKDVPLVPVLPLDPAALYARAEQAMRQGDEVAIEKNLREILARYPASLLADSARFELAQLALKRGNFLQAENFVEELLKSSRDPSLVLPARRLQCRLLSKQAHASQQAGVGGAKRAAAARARACQLASEP